MFKSDSFKGDPYGAITNQCGHMVLSAGVVPLSGINEVWIVYATVALYWLLIEFVAQGNKLWRDSIMDTAFVACGASYAITFGADRVAVVIIAAALMAFEWWSKR